VSDQGEGEAYQLEIINSDTLGPFRINYFVMDFTDEGFARES
jgi:hypothetical protein